MKTKELKALSKKNISELLAEVVSLQKKKNLLELNMFAGRESNLKARKMVRREIAQFLGIIHQKEQESKRVKEQEENK